MMLPSVWKRNAKLHESVRRLWCRMLFLLLGASPVCLGLLWILWSCTPWYASQRRRDWESLLANSLGMRVHVGLVREPSPEHFQLEQVIIQHPESQLEVVRVRMVEGFRRGEGWAVRLAQPEIQGDQLEACWRIAHDWFLCRPALTRNALAIAMNDVTIHGVAADARGRVASTRTLKDLQIDLLPQTDLITATLRYRHAEDPPLEAIRLQATRYHHSKDRHTELQLDTGRLAFPCSLLAGRFPHLGRMGPAAQFTGGVDLRMADSGQWSARIRGSVQQMDWHDVTEPFPFRLTGLGRIEDMDVVLNDGKIQVARGKLSGRNGLVHRKWLMHSRKLFGVPAPSSLSEMRESMVHYHAIDASFELSPSGLIVRGNLPTGSPPVQTANYIDGQAPNQLPPAIMRDADAQPMLPTPMQPLSIPHVVQWLSNSNWSEAKSTVEAEGAIASMVTQRILSALPLSSSQSPSVRVTKLTTEKTGQSGER
jgi:hypothetical protein